MPRGRIASEQGCRLSASGYVQLLKDEPDVVLYGLIAQLERHANLLIRFSLGKEREDMLLLGGEGRLQGRGLCFFL